MPRRLVGTLSAEHDETVRMLDACVDPSGAVDLRRFDDFRRRLLRHLAIEERLLFPALARRLGRVPEFQNGLRKDHAAIVQLCVPTPNADWISNLRELLVWHCRVEEAPAGFYELLRRHCDDDAALLKAVDGVPLPVLPPFQTGPQVRALIKQVLRDTGVTTDGLDTAP